MTTDASNDKTVEIIIPAAGYAAARKRAAAVQEEEAESQKPGFNLATQPDKKSKKDGADITGDEKPGFAKHNPEDPEKTADPLRGLGSGSPADLSGKGWIRCADGTYVRDDGRSIYVPGKKFTPAQMEMVVKLSADKGWSTLYAYKTNGKDLHPEATQMLSAALAGSGLAMQCCVNPKQAGSLRSHYHDAECAIRNMHEQRCRKAEAPAVPQPA